MARRLVPTLLLLFITASAAAGPIHIYDDPGGFFPDYAYRFSQIAANGDRVVIDGRCGSACTLVLTYVQAGRVCAMPGAFLQFHEASTREGTLWLRRHYPAGIMRWISAQGGLTARVLTLRGAALNRFVRPCDTMVASQR